jgi:ABC-type multidrug transport system fused ATPase/permease subunit
MPRSLLRLWGKLQLRRRKQFVSLIALMLVASFAEMLSIAAVIPFLSVLTAPDRLFNYAPIRSFASALGLESANQLLLPFTALFCACVVLAAAIRTLLIYATTRYSFAVGADLCAEIYRRTLYQPYAVHISRNTSEIINGVVTKTGLIIGNIVQPCMTLLSSALVLVGIVAAVIAISPSVAMISGVLFGIIYFAIVALSRRSIRTSSDSVARESTEALKSLQEGLGGIRDVLIDGTQEVYCRMFEKADRLMRGAQAKIIFLNSSPRYLVETVVLLLVAGVAYLLSGNPDGLVSTIPTLGAMALGAQRMLPIMQNGYASIVAIGGASTSLSDVLMLLDQPLPRYLSGSYRHTVHYNHQIALQDVGFRHAQGGEWILRNINLRIKKGEKVGLIGATGSGKSTLIDLIMGLLTPTEGVLRVDDKAITPDNAHAWQLRIAHVPQTIFLSDSSIKENIAFGVPPDQIDLERVRFAATLAHLLEFVEGMPKGFDTCVGERGIRLSGGQRQRIGIARALYKQTDIIIFDEATSALDNETERAVMEAIGSLSAHKTILTIAHRLSTLQDCDRVIELSAGSVSRTGSFQEIIRV